MLCLHWESLKLANRKIKNEVFKAKLKFKSKLGSEFASMKIKQAFHRVKILTGCKPKPNTCALTDPELFAKELNTFFARFDTLDFTAECEALLEALPLPEAVEPAPFTEEDVRRQLSRCKLGKALGPDGIPARVLKACANKLSPVLHSFFCESYQTATIPTLWKTATIIPVPKKSLNSTTIALLP